MPIMLAMIPSPRTPRTTTAPKLKISKPAMISLSMRDHQALPSYRYLTLSSNHIVFQSHRLPVAGLLEGVRGAIDGRFVEMAPDQHQADRQPIDHAAGQRHRRMVRDVE